MYLVIGYATIESPAVLNAYTNLISLFYIVWILLQDMNDVGYSLR